MAGLPASSLFYGQFLRWEEFVCIVDIGGIFVYHCYDFLFILMKEDFDDAKRVIRISKSKKDRQHNEWKKKNKRSNNDLQSITNKTKDKSWYNRNSCLLQRLRDSAFVLAGLWTVFMYVTSNWITLHMCFLSH